MAQKGKKRALKTVAIILGVFLVIGIGLVAVVFKGMGIRDDVIREPDLANLEDGTYVGALTGSRFANRLQVSVADGRITEITVLKGLDSQAEVQTKVIETVLAGQTLQIDAVGGASITTKAYLKSMEDALINRNQP